MLGALCRVVFIFLFPILSRWWHCTLLWLKCILPCIHTHKQKALHGWLNLIALPSCTKGSCFDFDLFSRSNNAPLGVDVTHVPLLKVQGWTRNTLALIDPGTDCTQIQFKLSPFCVCLINSWLSKRKIKQNGSGSESLPMISLGIKRKRKNKLCGEGIRLCTDCNYCTFSEWSWLQLQSGTFACMWVVTLSLSHCLNKGRVSAVIIN